MVTAVKYRKRAVISARDSDIFSTIEINHLTNNEIRHGFKGLCKKSYMRKSEKDQNRKIVMSRPNEIETIPIMWKSKVCRQVYYIIRITLVQENIETTSYKNLKCT